MTSSFTKTPGYNLIILVFCVTLLLCLLGLFVECSRNRDRYELKAPEDAKALYEASKFRRTE